MPKVGNIFEFLLTSVQWTKEAERATQLEDRIMALSNQLAANGDTESRIATLKERVAVVTRMNNEKTARIKYLEESAEKKDNLAKEWSKAIEVYESEVQRVTEENQRLLTEIELAKGSLKLVLKLAHEARIDEIDSEMIITEDPPQSSLMSVVEQLRDVIGDLTQGLEAQREALMNAEQKELRYKSIHAENEMLKKKKEQIELELEQARISAVGPNTISATGDLTDKSGTQVDGGHEDRIAQLEMYISTQAEMATKLSQELELERETNGEMQMRLEQAINTIQQLESGLTQTQEAYQQRESDFDEVSKENNRLKEQNRKLSKKIVKIQEELQGMSARKQMFEKEAAKEETEDLVQRILKQVKSEFLTKLDEKDEEIRRLKKKSMQSQKDIAYIAERDRIVEDQNIKSRSKKLQHQKSFGSFV